MKKGLGTFKYGPFCIDAILEEDLSVRTKISMCYEYDYDDIEIEKSDNRGNHPHVNEYKILGPT